MSVADQNYFKQRAEEERGRADSAASSAAANIHRALAAKYDALVQTVSERPRLHLAWAEGLRQRA